VSAAIDPITVEILSNGLPGRRRDLHRAYEERLLDQHQGAARPLDRDHRSFGPTNRAKNSLRFYLGSMMGLMNTLLAKMPLSDVREGDIFISNDPYAAGGTHLPDINMAAPVFADGKLVCFMCNIAHHADIGGITPGSMAGGTEIYQEGTRIPVIRLFRQGELQADILDLLLLNARVPHERRGDYFAQVAACRLGVRRVADMIEARGLPMLEAAFDEIIRRTRDRLLEALSRIPPGEYAFEDVMDDDGIGTTDIPIKLKVIVPPHGTNQKVLFDFTGTGPQVKGNINSTVTVTLAAVLYSLKALLDPDVPNNQGLIEIVDINAPPGTLINSKFPAAVAARANTAQRIVDVVIGALAPRSRRLRSAPRTARTPPPCSSATTRATTATTSISKRSAADSAGVSARTARTACRCTSPTRPTCPSRRSRWSIRCVWRSTL
jgi:N-methylhydantoinase B